jgi:hypothetical protein
MGEDLARRVSKALTGNENANQDQKIKPAVCPKCEVVLDGAIATFEEATPQPGDVSICAVCGNVALYTPDMQLRKPTRKEAREIAAMLRRKLGK